MVQAEDAYGNLVTSFNASVLITSNPSGVSGTTSVTASSGVATFTNLILSSTGSYTLTAAASGLTSATSSSFTVSSLGQIAGQFNLQNYCYNGNNNLPVTFTVTLTNTSTHVALPTTTTNITGGYSFSNVPPGTYTITPSVAGAASPASLFYPSDPLSNTTGVVVTNGTNLPNENFTAQVGFTVSGTVSYNGSQKGQTYLTLNGGCSPGNGSLGTSLPTTQTTGNGSFTIRGVQPGSYTLTAWMDPLANAIQNAIDPMGSTTNGSITVSDGDVTGADVTMADPTFTTPTSNPTISAIVPTAQGFIVEFNPSENSNHVEDANQYTVQWSTSSALGGGSGGGQFSCAENGNVCPSHTFAANGSKGAWLLSNASLGAGTFVTGTKYYFQARSFNTLAADPHPAGWCDYDSSSSNGCSPTPTVTSTFTGTTAGAIPCTGTCTIVTGTVTIPSGLTCPLPGDSSDHICPGAPLYLGLLQFSNGNSGGPSAIYATTIASPVVGANSFTLTVPSGSNYGVFGVLDQLNNGGFGVGAVQNTQQNFVANLTISGGSQTLTGSQNATLPATNSLATVTTQYSSSTCSGCSGTSTSYQLNFEVVPSNRLPVAVTLNSGPNVINTAGTVAIDMTSCPNCNNNGGEYQYSAALAGGAPKVGDTYGFTVTYSDGTTDPGTVVNGAVTAFGSTGAVVGPSDLPTLTSPASGTTAASDTPTFTWTWPAEGLTSDTYYYQFSLSNNSGVCEGNSCSNDVWQVPSGNSGLNGFTYAEDQGSPYGGTSTTGSLTWGNDPSGSGSSPSPSSLTTGNTYNWEIQVQDSNNYPSNSAQSSVYFTAP